MRPQSEPWWRQSQADLERAKRSFEPDGYYASVWFVQQAIEKGLKALFVERHGALPARTHDVELLGMVLAVPASVLVHLATINPTFIRTRYPDMGTLVAPVDSISEADASEQLEAAEEVMAWLEAQLFPKSIQR